MHLGSKKKKRISDVGYWRYSRQFNINPARRVLSVIEHGVVVQLETGLHAVVIVELDKGEAAALARGVFPGCNAD